MVMLFLASGEPDLSCEHITSRRVLELEGEADGLAGCALPLEPRYTTCAYSQAQAALHASQMLPDCPKNFLSLS